jgi:hypothetical protein
MNDNQFGALLAQLTELTKAVISLRNTLSDGIHIQHDDLVDLTAAVDGCAITSTAIVVKSEDVHFGKPGNSEPLSTDPAKPSAFATTPETIGTV